MDARQQQEQQQHQQQQMNSGLMRYRSAPSTLIASFMENQEVGESEGCDDFIPSHHPPPLPPPPPRSSSPEAEIMFARFMTNCGDSASPDLGEMEEKFTSNRNCQYMNPNLEHGSSESTTKYSQIMYQTQQPVAAMPEAYRGVSNSVATQHLKISPAPAPAPPHSNLIRHSSSPAGLFSHLSVENGYAVMRGIGNSRAGNGSNGEVAASASRLKGQISYSPGPPSSSGLMSQISEIESDSMGATSETDGGSLSNSNANNRYIPNFPLASWDDSALENFSGLKRARDGNNKMMSGLNSTEPQNGEPGNRTPSLSHHYSLPKNSAEMAAILQFQDSVPCKIRAKRGCATHPRSIAERVRRTRISERMRKLQELVPNMDKQTNTADMLDLAVEYIKDLQKQVKTLNDNRANCTCSSKQKPYQNSRV